MKKIKYKNREVLSVNFNANKNMATVTTRGKTIHAPTPIYVITTAEAMSMLRRMGCTPEALSDVVDDIKRDLNEISQRRGLEVPPPPPPAFRSKFVEKCRLSGFTNLLMHDVDCALWGKVAAGDWWLFFGESKIPSDRLSHAPDLWGGAPRWAASIEYLHGVGAFFVNASRTRCVAFRNSEKIISTRYEPHVMQYTAGAKVIAEREVKPPLGWVLSKLMTLKVAK